jgi:sugar/nucleoside kinase (ribokinase family)
MMASITGIGNALVDIIIRISDDKLLGKFGLPRGSMTMIDAGKAENILRETGHLHFDMAQGGAVANTISGIANLGMTTGYIGKIGNDDLGYVFRKGLEEVRSLPNLLTGSSPTGRAITLVTPDGERTFGTYLGAAVEMTPAELDPEFLKDYDWIIVEGYLVFNRELIMAALKLARGMGLKIAMDMASYNLVDNNREFILSILEKYIDVVFANELEAKALTGCDDPKEALSGLARICPVVVVKVGRDGSWIARENEIIRVNGIAADCVDTTGAGDLYAAGFLYGMLSGFSLAESGRIGSVLGGSVVEVIGARLNTERWGKIREELFS